MFWVVSKADNSKRYDNWFYFMCDSLSDIDTLPTQTANAELPIEVETCAPGSECLCLETGEVYILNGKNDTWTKKKNTAGGAGVGIANIEKTGTEGLVDTYTITLTDDSTYTFTVTNGKNGTNGKDGAPGKDGASGAAGAPGEDGTDGRDGKDGTTPTIGENGNWYLGDVDTGKPSQGKSAEIPLIQKESTDTAVTLEANQYYAFPEMAALTITLSPARAAIYQKYLFSFQSGNTPTVLTLPEDVKSSLVVEANRIYEVSIGNNLLSWTSWEL